MASDRRVYFDRFGRTYQLRIACADDLRTALQIDEAHWVATSAPVFTLRGDPAFLGLVDADGNGRIRVRELKNAVEWLLEHLEDAADVALRRAVLRLDAVNTATETGKRIELSGRKMLASLGKSETGEISLDEVQGIKRSIEATTVSEAGVVLPEAADEPQVHELLADIVGTGGGAAHPGGGRGVGAAELSRFKAQARACLQWEAEAVDEADHPRPELAPLGEKTAEAFNLLQSVRVRIDHYFSQCRATAFDVRFAQGLRPSLAQIAQADLNEADQLNQLLKEAGVATPNAEGVLDFDGPLNPLDRSNLDALRKQVLTPILEPFTSTLSAQAWRDVLDRFAPYERRLSARPHAAVRALGREKLLTYRDGDLIKKVEALIARSGDTVIQLDNVRLVEKLLLLQSNLLDLANNFISFPKLYDPTDRAMFETGSLVLDGRRFEMAVKVENRAEHVKVTQTSDMFVIYVQLDRQYQDKSYEVAVPVTSGGKGNLAVGKRGVFFDIDGREWDARVVQIIENPINLSEAVVAPFKRIGSLISGKIEQFTGAAEKRLDQATEQSLSQVESSAATKGPGVPTAADSANRSNQQQSLLAGGVLVGGGLAVAALGSAVAFITRTVADMNWLTIVGGVGGAVGAVLLPSTLLASLKLRRRDLSCILEGSGWAVNARMRLTRRQSRNFTMRPPYPKGARGVRRYWSWILLLVLVAAMLAALSYARYHLLERAAGRKAIERGLVVPPAPNDPAVPPEAAE